MNHHLIQILTACPDVQWEVIFSLARYGGIRVPSELLPLTWADIDFHTGNIRICSPKTEAYEGKAERLVPMFPELRAVLQEAFDEAEEGSEHVITRYRDLGANLRTSANRVIRGPA